MATQNADSSVLIDTAAAMSNLMDDLDAQPSTSPSLYIDLEGVNLSRHGTISIIQVYVLPLNRTCLIDVHTLRSEVFSTPGSRSGRTFKDILESGTVPKVFFDVRRDSDALYAHFQITLNGVHDLQLMELATRPSQKRFTFGLARCIELDAGLTVAQRTAWKAKKELGLNLFDPTRGGSYQVFNERPLREEVKAYCVQDVQFLPLLWARYKAKLTSAWEARVVEATRERVAVSQAPGFNPQGRNMAEAPAGWA